MEHPQAQMIATAPYEDQGLVAPAGEPEPLADVLDWAEEEELLVEAVESRVLGWPPYTRILRIPESDPYSPARYYLAEEE
jgi:hypothetical protein